MNLVFGEERFLHDQMRDDDGGWGSFDGTEDLMAKVPVGDYEIEKPEAISYAN